MASWSTEREESARRMYADGRTDTEIARALGVSRGAMIGKRHREGWDYPGRTDPHTARPRPGRELPAPELLIPSEPKSIWDIGPGECRWPLGDWQNKGPDNLRHDPPVTLFCSEDVLPGQSWCPAHCRRAFTPQGLARLGSPSFFRNHGGRR